MRRNLWIAISLILPAVFLYVMKTRPPVSPGIKVEERLMPSEIATGTRADRKMARPDAGSGLTHELGTP